MTAQQNCTHLGLTPVPFSQRYLFRSHNVGAPFVIDVAMPPAYMIGDEPLPLLLVTDGNMGFATAASTAAILPIEPGGPQPACVVGIGYELAGDGSHGEQFSLRNRDLTPFRDEAFEADLRAAPPPFHLPPDIQSGGGEIFLDFIDGELKPWLAERFPVNTAECTLAGSSLGAMLALHAMFTRPDAFARILAISPSLWWAGGHIAQLEEGFARQNDDLAAKLYLCVGEAEEAQAPEAKMVTNFSQFAKKLQARAYPSLQLAQEILPGETHVSAYNTAISKGIRHLFTAQTQAD